MTLSDCEIQKDTDFQESLVSIVLFPIRIRNSKWIGYQESKPSVMTWSASLQLTKCPIFHKLKNTAWSIYIMSLWWGLVGGRYLRYFIWKQGRLSCMYASEKSVQELLLANNGRHMLGTSATHNSCNKSTNYEQNRKSISAFSSERHLVDSNF